MPLNICLVLAEESLARDLEVYEQHRDWVDMVELRADKLRPEERTKLRTWPLLGKIPNILTLRRTTDGGDYRGDDEDRLAFYQMHCDEGWDWWDIEEGHPLPENLESEYRSRGGKILRSFHDFQGLPPDAAERARAMFRGSDAVKIAVALKDSSTLGNVFKLAEELNNLPRVIIGMGAYGLATRVLGLALGSLWTYATSHPGPNDLGQIDPKTLKEVYRVHQWTSDDAVYGVVGNPIHHSKSPIFHNAGFRALGIRSVYLPFLANNLEDVLRIREHVNLRGVSVTIPFKEQAAHLAAVTEESVRACKAANTLVLTAGGWAAHNTDTLGFLRPLLKKWGCSDLKGKKITVIGSGGAARGVVWALKQAGAQVLILGRTFARAEALARDLDALAAPLAPESLDLVEKHQDAVIQTTSAGMADQIDVDPFSFYPWSGKEIAYDIIYNPPITKFLEHAQSRGCQIIRGVEMFVEQASEQFELFTGLEYPQNLMHDPKLFT